MKCRHSWAGVKRLPGHACIDSHLFRSVAPRCRIDAYAWTPTRLGCRMRGSCGTGFGSCGTGFRISGVSTDCLFDWWVLRWTPPSLLTWCASELGVVKAPREGGVHHEQD